jgi:hypothetical protein
MKTVSGVNSHVFKRNVIDVARENNWKTLGSKNKMFEKLGYEVYFENAKTVGLVIRDPETQLKSVVYSYHANTIGAKYFSIVQHIFRNAEQIVSKRQDYEK